MALRAGCAPGTRWLFRIIGAIPVVLASCSSSTNTASSPHVDASAVCPATPELTNGQRCAPEGLRCAPEYACGVTTGILSCTCTSGIFQCRDGRDLPVDPGAAPPCTVRPFEAGACPATESAAEFAPCSEQGQLCAYPSTCAGTFDSCECFAGRTRAGQFGLRFECAARSCLYLEAGVSPELDAAATSDSEDAVALGELDGSDAASTLEATVRTEADAPDAQVLDATSVDATD